MKHLTRLALLVAGIAVAGLPAFAADQTASNPAPTEHAKHPRLRAMLKGRAELRKHAVKRLDLTAAQKEQLKAKRAETKSALKALRADTSLTKEQKRAKAKELIAGARGTFKSTLTPEQQGKIDQMRERVRKHRHHRRAL